MGAESVPCGAQTGLHFAESGWPVHRNAPLPSGQIGVAERALHLWQNEDESDSWTPSFVRRDTVSPPTSSPPSVPGIWKLLLQSQMTLVRKGPHPCLCSQG